MTGAVIRFDDALESAINFCRTRRDELGNTIVIVRDIVGRVRVATKTAPGGGELFWQPLHLALGPWSPGIGGLSLIESELLEPSAIFDAPDRKILDSGLALLERWVSERDWVRRSDSESPKCGPRIAFFGVKGGVGRSTALVATARHLAEQGKRVVVIDLDLESPGISASLLPEAGRPPYGVVDWFVESGVGQADDDLLLKMMAASPLASGTTGNIRVVPAVGAAIDTYVNKLGRLQLSSAGTTSFANSLGKLITAIEARERPAAVLIDCRAGIDDLAASTITRLATDAFLFAVGTPQTWLAYRMLFSAWDRDPHLLVPFRDGLRVIASLVPPSGRDTYIQKLLENSHSLFEDYVYEEVEAGAEAGATHETALDAVATPVIGEAFNFDLKDDSAPHYPIPVYWGREFQDWDPVGTPETVTPAQLTAAFEELFAYVDGLIVSESEAQPS